MSSILEVNSLSFKYDRQRVLEDINFEVLEGDYVGIIGANGSGKTTLIKILLGLISSYEGQIKYEEDILKSSSIGYVPQHGAAIDRLFPATAGEIVFTGLLSKKGKLKFYSKRDYNKVDIVLKRLKIENLKNKRIGNLSGGQRQRVLLARAMIADPKILILDEPTSALDPEIREEFYKLLKELNDGGVTIVLVSHDIASIEKYINKILYLDKRLVFYGGYDEFHHSKEMARCFGLLTED